MDSADKSKDFFVQIAIMIQQIEILFNLQCAVFSISNLNNFVIIITLKVWNHESWNELIKESIWISFKWNENASLQDQFYNYN